MEKITLSELSEGLARRMSISRKEAEAFARTVFDIIKENLPLEQTVKVKNLGSFKLIQVGSRESVNVNTGERITIDSHSRLSFTPDKALSDRINRPFADFETVVLNDATKTEDMERIDLPVVEPLEDMGPIVEPVVETIAELSIVEPLSAPADIESESEPESLLIEPEPASEPEPMQIEPESTPVESEPVPASEPESVLIEPEPEQADVAPAPLSAPTPSIEHPVVSRRRCGWWCALSACVALLVGGLLYWCYMQGYFCPDRPDIAVAEQPVAAAASAPVETQTDTVPVPDTLLVAEDVPAEQPVVATPPVEASPATQAKDYPQIENGEYWIVGTKTVHTLAKGEDLSKLALKYYEDKRLISYIIRFNRYTTSQASNLFVGAEVRIPELVKKGE